MPGVTVTTSVRSGPSGASDLAASQFFVVGTAERGPVDEPTLIRGMSEYKANYGDYVAGNLYAHLKTFFEEGGSRAYVYRVVGTGASTSYLDLDDALSVATLRISAANPGLWGDSLSVEVVAGDAANTVKIKLYIDGILTWTSRDLLTPADAANVINVSYISRYIEATDLESGSTFPSNMPAVIAETNLADGADGSAPGTSDYTDGLDYFTYDLGCGAVAIPGQHGDTVWGALIDHAVANNRIALCAFGEAESISTVQSDLLSFFGTEGYTNAHYAAFYYPWLYIPSPATQGLTLSVSPEAFAAAARSKAIVASGPWFPGAGLPSESRFITAPYAVLTRAQADALDEKRINAIRKIGSKVRVYGARSASNDEDNWRYITLRDTVNYIVTEAEKRLEDLVFTPIDARGRLFSQIEAVLIGLLDPIRLEGGLYEAFDDSGKQVDPGYSVQVTDEINPAEDLALGKVNANVGVRVSSVGDQILVTVTKSNLLTSVS